MNGMTLITLEMHYIDVRDMPIVCLLHADNYNLLLSRRSRRFIGEICHAKNELGGQINRPKNSDVAV